MNKLWLILLLGLIIVPSVLSVWDVPEHPMRKVIQIGNTDSSDLPLYSTITVSGFDTTNISHFNKSLTNNFNVYCDGVEVDKLFGNETDLRKDASTKLYPASTGWYQTNTTFLFRLPHNVTSLNTDTKCNIYYGNQTHTSTANNMSNIALFYDDFNRGDGNLSGKWFFTQSAIVNNRWVANKTDSGAASSALDVFCADCTKYKLDFMANATGSSSGISVVLLETADTGAVQSYNGELGHRINPEANTSLVETGATVAIKSGPFNFSAMTDYVLNFYSLGLVDNGDFSAYNNSRLLNWTYTNNTQTRDNATLRGLRLVAAKAFDDIDYVMLSRWTESHPNITLSNQESGDVQIVESADPLNRSDTNVITLYVSADSIANTNATLYWNDVSYGSGVRTKLNSTTYSFVNTFTVPSTVGSQSGQNISYYWTTEIEATEKFNSTGQQTVYSPWQGQLILGFRYLNLSSALVNGYWSAANNRTENFTATNQVINLTNVPTGLIRVYFGFNDSIMNFTQFYEFKHSTTTASTTTNLSILEKGNENEVFFKVVDTAGQVLDDALIRVGVSEPPAGGGPYYSVGQRYTGNDFHAGMASFYIPPDMDIVVEVSKTGYAPYTRQLNIQTNAHTSASPLIIRLDEIQSSIVNGVEVSTYPVGYYDPTNYTDIHLSISAPGKSSWYFYTNYTRTSSNSNFTEDFNSNYLAFTQLNRGTHFCPSCTDDLIIHIWVDGEYNQNITLQYQGVDDTRFTAPEGLDDLTERRLIWLGLLVSSSLLGLLFRSDDEGIGSGKHGKTFFLIGCFLVPVIFSWTMSWLALLVAAYGFGLIMRKYISE